MKKIIFALLCTPLVLIGCTNGNKSVKHESPIFLAVVDSICEKNATEDGNYSAKAVKKGFHEYINYYGAAAPCFKDLPLIVTETMSSKTLDGKEQYVTAFMSYTYEETIDDVKYVYSISVNVENVIKAEDTMPFEKDGVYYISPNSDVLVHYDGMLDVIGRNEIVAGGGKIVDGRSFGTIKIKDANFTPVK